MQTVDLLLPAPTAEDLQALQAELGGLSAAKMAELFGLSGGNRWREYVGASGERVRVMEAHRYSLTLLSLGRHPKARAVKS